MIFSIIFIKINISFTNRCVFDIGNINKKDKFFRGVYLKSNNSYDFL